MSDFEQMLQEYQRLYTAWCKFGNPCGIVRWIAGRGGSGYTTQPSKTVDITQCCEEGKYIDTLKPWLHYDKTTDVVTIYSVHYKSHSEVLLFNVSKSSFPKHELIRYANENSLRMDVLLGRRPFEHSKKKDVEIAVLQGPHSVFIAAGWEKEIQDEVRKREQEIAAYQTRCVETSRRITESISMIESAYNSAAMKAVESYTHSCADNSGVFFSSHWDYTLYTHGVMWHKLKRSITEASWFMPFSKIGFANLETDEQLFCFSAAMFCRKQGIPPADLDVTNIAWNCQIKADHNGTFINNPRLMPESTEEPPLQAIFSDSSS